MRTKHLAVFIPLLLGIALPVAAQSKESSRRLTVDQAIELAERNAPRVRVAIRQVAMAQSKVTTAGALDDPMLMYKDWGTPLKKPWDLNQSQNMFMLQQTFPGSGKRAARAELASKDVDIAKAQVEMARQDARSQVRKLAADLLRNADQMRLHDQQAELTRNAIQAALAKYTVGKAPQQDVLKAQIVLARLGEHLVELQRERDAAEAELNTLVGLDPSSPIEITGTYRPEPQIPATAVLQQTAIQNRPELRGLQHQIESAESQSKLARLSFKPDLTVAGGYMLMPSGSMYRNNYMAELTINLPWLNRSKHENEVRQADVAAEVGRSEAEAQKAAAFLEIQQALIKVRSAQKNIAIYRDTLKPQAEATFQAAAAAYQNDRTDFLNLLDSQNMLLDVQDSYFKSQAELDAALAELERAIGAPLPAAPQTAESENKQ